MDKIITLECRFAVHRSSVHLVDEGAEEKEVKAKVKESEVKEEEEKEKEKAVKEEKEEKEKSPKGRIRGHARQNSEKNTEYS